MIALVKHLSSLPAPFLRELLSLSVVFDLHEGMAFAH